MTLTLELVIEDDTVDVGLALTELLNFAQVRLADLTRRVRPRGASRDGIELPAVLVVAVTAVRFEKVSTAVRQDDNQIAVTFQSLGSDPCSRK